MRYEYTERVESQKIRVVVGDERAMRLTVAL